MLEIVDSHNSPARIKVFGVGGGGSNAVNRMIQAGLTGVEFWVANTDMQALQKATCSNRLQIGCTVTRGLGAGGDPEIGRLSAQEDRDAISEILRGTDMLFITAGMGGGTGTGAAPVVAEIARESGILTVAVVTKPFAFEGKKKFSRAQAGLAELGRHVDTLIAIPNQKLLNIVEPGTPFLAAMLVADEVLFQATRGISDLITGHGEINLDFADVKTVMRNRGNALLGCGVATGKGRAIEAAQAAVSSPLLEEVSIFGAEALLINVQGGPGMGLHEAAEAAQFISERVGEDADVFWGAVVDPSLEDEMRVTLIATGFSRSEAATGEANVRVGSVSIPGFSSSEGSASPERRVDPVWSEAVRATARAEIARGETARTESARTETARAETLRAETVRAEAARSDSVRGDTSRGDAGRGEPVRSETARGDTGRSDTGRIDTGRGETVRSDNAEPARAEAARKEVPSSETVHEMMETMRSPLDRIFAPSAGQRDDDFRTPEERELLPSSWDYGQPVEQEIFLSTPPPAPVDHFYRPPVIRETWEPAPSATPGLKGTRGGGSFVHRLDPAEPRLGRRNPLDEPTFMRKRMD